MSAATPARARTVAHLLLIALAGVACYANALHVPFVYDDATSIVDNAAIGSWSQGRSESSARRVAYLTFKLNYRLGGLDPFGYHVVNVLIHVLAGFAVYALARALLRLAARGRAEPERLTPEWPALAGALLFVVHPIQTQAVTYVVQRMASLAGLFYVAALAAYAWARQGDGRRRWLAYAGAVGCAALATFTKENAFTLPFAVALLELSFGAGSFRRRSAAVAPFVALLPAIPLIALRAAGSVSGVRAAGVGEPVLSRLDYLATQTRVVVTYLRMLVLPVGQSIEHDPPVARGFGSPTVLGASVLLAALAVAGVALLGRRRPAGLRVAGFGILLFFLALSVESSVIPIVDVMFEHRLYLPIAGAALAVAGIVHAAVERRARAARAVAVIVTAVAVALAVATVLRNEIWNDPVSLWRGAVRTSPNKVRVHLALGNALLEAGDLGGAVAAWQRAAEIQPTYSLAWNQLGNVARLQGDRALAEERYRRALAGVPRNPEALYNLALVLEATGRAGEAIPYYRTFVAEAPPGREREVARLRERFGW